MFLEIDLELMINFRRSIKHPSNFTSDYVNITVLQADFFNLKSLSKPQLARLLLVPNNFGSHLPCPTKHLPDDVCFIITFMRNVKLDSISKSPKRDKNIEDIFKKRRILKNSELNELNSITRFLSCCSVKM